MAVIWILLWPSSGSFCGRHLDPCTFDRTMDPSMAVILILLWPSSGSFYGRHMDPPALTLILTA